jgi:hypothetical protein
MHCCLIATEQSFIVHAEFFSSLSTCSIDLFISLFRLHTAVNPIPLAHQRLALALALPPGVPALDKLQKYEVLRWSFWGIHANICATHPGPVGEDAVVRTL